MEGKYWGDCYYEAIAEPHTGTSRAQRRTTRPPPKRGSIKRAIFAEILDALQRIGTTLAEILDTVKRMAASACKMCSPGKAKPSASAIDLLRALMP
uniref:Uncharacterized protein n=1 Tax=Picea sitchensis TaxID=3332 RepID=B8LRV7_PICSI|nr:unknown [Picea sitchensis]